MYGAVCAAGPPAERARLRAGARARAHEALRRGGGRRVPAALFTVPYAPPSERESEKRDNLRERERERKKERARQ